jgi:hypothetical protein
MEPKALDLLASKVATEFKGDARRMLQLCMCVNGYTFCCIVIANSVLFTQVLPI